MIQEKFSGLSPDQISRKDRSLNILFFQYLLERVMCRTNRPPFIFLFHYPSSYIDPLNT